MRLLKKDDYISKVSKLKTKHDNKVNSIKYKEKKKKRIEKINKRAFKYFVRKINKVNTYKEPRQFWFWFDSSFDFAPSDFLPCIIKLESAFDYLNFDVNLNYNDDSTVYSIKLEVNLKG